MGIGKNGYYTTRDICAHNALYNIILSGRGAGKSYAIACEKNRMHKGYLVNALERKDTCVAYLRRFRDDVAPSLVEDDFADKLAFIERESGGEYNAVKAWRNKLFFAKIDDSGDVKKAPWAFGQIFALNTASRYKSRQYPTVTDIVFEESVASDDERYLKNETEILQNLVSTIFRDRQGYVWMLGNTVSRYSPYFCDWALRGVRNMKEGQIDTYVIDDTKIAVELSPNRNTDGKMFFGKERKSITGSKWHTNEFLQLPKDFSTYEILDTVTIDGGMFLFTLHLLMDDNANMCLYIYPAKRMSEYIIQGDATTDIFNRAYHLALDAERKTHELIRKCWRDGKVAYANNLCGQDFNDFLKNHRRIL